MSDFAMSSNAFWVWLRADDVITLDLMIVIFYSKCHFHVVWHPPWLQSEKVIWHLRFAKDSAK